MSVDYEEIYNSYQFAAFTDDANSQAAEPVSRLRAQFLESSRPETVAQLAEECRAFQRLLIDGYPDDARPAVAVGIVLAIGRDVLRRWLDCMRVLAGTAPPMRTVQELTPAEAILDVGSTKEHLDELQAAVDLVIRCCAEQAPTGDTRRNQTGGEQGKGAGKGKGKGGRRRLANPKLQVYMRIKQEHDAGTARRDIPDRLKGDRDFMDLLAEARITSKKKPVQKPNAVLVKNALAYFSQPPRKKQETTGA